MSTINPELANLLDRLSASDEASLAQAKDDQIRAGMIDRLARMDADQFTGLAQAIVTRSSADLSDGDLLGFVICELAMVGWTVAVESLRERRELEAA